MATFSPVRVIGGAVETREKKAEKGCGPRAGVWAAVTAVAEPCVEGRIAWPATKERTAAAAASPAAARTGRSRAGRRRRPKGSGLDSSQRGA